MFSAVIDLLAVFFLLVPAMPRPHQGFQPQPTGLAEVGFFSLTVIVCLSVLKRLLKVQNRTICESASKNTHSFFTPTSNIDFSTSLNDHDVTSEVFPAIGE